MIGSQDLENSTSEGGAIAELSSLPAMIDAEDMGNAQMTAGSGDVIAMQNSDLERLPPEDPVERLRNMIGERQEETVEILRGWLEDKEEKV